MNVRHKTIKVLLAPMMVVLMAGCASRATATATAAASREIKPTSNSSAESSPVGLYVGPIIEPLNYANVGVTVDPPGGEVAKVTPSEANATCATGDASCPYGIAPTISLGKATSIYAGTHEADGKFSPLMSETLVYMLSWSDLPYSPTNVPVQQTSDTGTGAVQIDTQSPSTVYKCVQITFVDANSGDVLYGFSSPTP